MPKGKKKAKSAKKPAKASIRFRFIDAEHHKLVVQAAKSAGLSMNAWLVQATLRSARLELGLKV